MLIADNSIMQSIGLECQSERDNKNRPTHKQLVQKYGQKKNLEDFLNDDILITYKEKDLHELFGINSYKCPDLCAIAEDRIYIGEIKQNDCARNRRKATRQVLRYVSILMEEKIDCDAFIIVGESYKEIIDLDEHLDKDLMKGKEEDSLFPKALYCPRFRNDLIEGIIAEPRYNHHIQQS